MRYRQSALIGAPVVSLHTVTSDAIAEESDFHVLYDGWIYKIQSAGGINRYFEWLIQSAPAGWRRTLVTEDRRTVNFPTSGSFETRVVPRVRWRRPLKGLGLSAEALCVKWSTRKVTPDLFHPTYYRCLPGMDRWRGRVPVVLTVMDMIHERFSEILDPDGRIAGEKAAAIARADFVLCPSESTCADLMEILDVPRERILVIPLASEMASLEPVSPSYAPQGPYFIYVGSRASYKNFDGLLRAFVPVAEDHPAVRLCVVGTPWSTTERARLRELGLADRVILRVLPNDRELSRLYRESVALVYPSLYEGFGIPPLEAMGCGTAVIATSTSSIPEVVGEAAVMVQSQSDEDLSHAMEKLLKDAAERSRRIEAGAQRAALFSWERTVQQTFAAYQSLVQGMR